MTKWNLYLAHAFFYPVPIVFRKVCFPCIFVLLSF
jgi:hypothetical protein